jgi:FtsH-binding integral membrane protein
MSTRKLQYLLASVFFVLGGWCVVAPSSVVDLGLRTEYRSSAQLVPVLVVCFGSQALLSGLFAAASRFTRWTFLLFGIALIPFFVGDLYFYFAKPMLTEIGMADLVGNLIMLALCVAGWRQESAEPAR